MRVEGVMLMCSRCGREHFHPWKMMHNKYPNEMPSDWLTVDKDSDIHLCPNCAKAYVNIFTEFIEGGKNT